MPWSTKSGATVRSFEDLDPAVLERVRRRMQVDGKGAGVGDLQSVLDYADRIGLQQTLAPVGGVGGPPTAGALRKPAGQSGTQPLTWQEQQNARHAALLEQAGSLGIQNAGIMASGELENAIARKQSSTIEAGRQQFGNATQAQIQQAQGLGIETAGMNAQSMQAAIDAAQPIPTGKPTTLLPTVDSAYTVGAVV